MRLVLAAMLWSACSTQEAARAPDDWQERLSIVARPEPAGLLEVVRGSTALAPTRIRRDDVFLVVQPLDVPDGVEVRQIVTAGRFEELRRMPRAVDRIELSYSVTLGSGLVSLRVVDDYVEALDARGVARLRTEPAFAVDSNKTIRKLLPRLTQHGVAWTADARDLVPPIAIDPAWTATKSLARPVSGPNAFAIPGKKVIYVENSYGLTEIYDDATSSWTAGPAMNISRLAQAAQLEDGRIFIAAGNGLESPIAGEIFDPATSKWTAIAASPFTGGVTSSGVLKGSRVLVIQNANASIYDATTNTWTKPTGAPTTARRAPWQTRLNDDRMLIVGGSAAGSDLSSAEIFDPATGTFSAVGSLSRTVAAYQRLGDGRVIAIGGLSPAGGGTILDTTEIFDPSTKMWTPGPKMNAARYQPGSAVLSDGRVLAVAGLAADALLTSTEIFDPATSKWTLAGEVSQPRSNLAVVAIDANRLLAIGGYNGGFSNAADVLELLANGKACKDAGECKTVSCVDGFCCEKPSCAADETCGGSSAPGKCKKRQGTACTSGDVCGNGVCVDGVCCDRACDGLCEACDLTASKGTCAVLAPGDSPHGTRGKCPGVGECAASCGGVDGRACTLFPGPTTFCGTASCSDGVQTSASRCDGVGTCLPAPTEKCEPFTCAATECKRGCAADADCANGYSCDTRTKKCVFGAKCDGEHTVIVPGGTNIECTPFKCAGAACVRRCSSTNECVAGTTCDTASGDCVVSAPAASDEGGCSYARRRSDPSVLLLAFLAILRRRKP
jgi:hypothetical protein